MKREPQSGNHETLPDAVTRSHRLHLCTQRAYPQQGRLGMSNKTKNSRVRLRHWFQISAIAAAIGSAPASRSEERRVGKECRYGWTRDDNKKKQDKRRKKGH